MDFFRESWRQKISPKLNSLEKPEDQIEYLLFVRYDAAENQILTWTDEAENFLDSLDTRLRQLYRELFETVRDGVKGYPREKQKDRLRELLLTERQRAHRDATPSFDNLSSLVKDEIEKIDLHHRKESDSNIRSASRDTDSPISGHSAPEYAVQAAEILRENPEIASFSRLIPKMEEGMVSGESKVDTVKRGIGYDDLPSEKKTFIRFKKLLHDKIAQMQRVNSEQ
jgi:hypothetical protein